MQLHVFVQDGQSTWLSIVIQNCNCTQMQPKAALHWGLPWQLVQVASTIKQKADIDTICHNLTPTHLPKKNKKNK